MRKPIHVVVALLAPLLCAVPAHAQRSAFGRWAMVADGTGTGLPPVGSEPYAPYPDLDLATVYFHDDAGAWGDACHVDTPDPPVTTRQVSVDTSAEFNTEAAVDGSEITITAGWAETVVVGTNAEDLDIIINSGVTIGAIEYGSPSAVEARIRIRGPTIGSHSGGQMGMVRQRWNSLDFEDLIVDGIDINGSGEFGGSSEESQCFRVGSTDGNDHATVRMAVVNTRCIAPGYAWLGRAQHVVIGGSSIYHGAATRAEAGYSEGWGIRNIGGPFIIVDSDIRGTRYVQLRLQGVGAACEVALLRDNIFVAIAEGGTAWMWDSLNNETPPTEWRGDGAVLEGGHVYSYNHADCSGHDQDIRIGDVDYSRVTGVVFHGAGEAVWSQASLDAVDAAATGDHDWSVGNTFSAWDQSEPAWGGAGDPTAIALPGGMTLVTGEDSCPGAYAP